MPWIAPDEMVYGLLGRGAVAARLARHPRRADAVLLAADAGARRLPAGRVRARHGLRRAAGAPGARDVAGGGARVPLGAVARVTRGAALVAAALAVAVPGLAYSGLVMTEVLFYPLLVLAAWAGAEAIARPTRHDAAARSWSRSLAVVRDADAGDRAAAGAGHGRAARRVARSVVGAAAAAVAGGRGARRAAGRWLVVAARLRRRGARRLRGGRQTRRTASARAAKYVVYHLAVAADPLRRSSRVRAVGAHARARRCAAASPTRACARTWRSRPRSRSGSCVEVGIFASHYSDRIVERNLIGARAGALRRARAVARRGRAGGVRGARGGRAAALAVLARPAGQAARERLRDARRDDADPAVQAVDLRRRRGRCAWVYSAVRDRGAPWCSRSCRGGHLRWRAARARRRAASAPRSSSSRFVVDAGARPAAHLPRRRPRVGRPRRRQRRSPTSTTASRRGRRLGDGVLEHAHRPRLRPRLATVPGPLPQDARRRSSRDGTVVVPPSARRRRRVRGRLDWIELVGERKAQTSTSRGLTQSGLVLWKRRTTPMRLRTGPRGSQLNGDIYAQDHGAARRVRAARTALPASRC